MDACCEHLNMLCLLYKQHRPITLLYIAIRYVHDSRYLHPTPVSLNLGNGEVSVQALYGHYDPQKLADCKGSECEELVVPKGSAEYYF